MMVQHCSTAYEDERGYITDILQDAQVEHAAVITCKVGSMRGHHYHKKSLQYAYVLTGRFKVVARRQGETTTESAIVVAGDLVTHVPLERHAFEALDDSTLLVLTHGPRGGEHYEHDTFRETL